MTAAGPTIMDTPREATLTADQDLIRLACAGNMQAYGDLVRSCRAGVVNVVYRMCGDMALAEEASQEAFLRAWQHLSDYDPRRAFRAWLYRIAINAALDVLRRERPQDSLEELVEREALPAEGSAGPEAAVEQRERASDIRRAVMALPSSTRAVLVLREYGQLSYAEIAAALGIPLGTVMSRLNTARSQLRQALAGRLEVI